jgi:hypothetical protein
MVVEDDPSNSKKRKILSRFAKNPGTYSGTRRPTDLRPPHPVTTPAPVIKLKGSHPIRLPADVVKRHPSCEAENQSREPMEDPPNASSYHRVPVLVAWPFDDERLWPEDWRIVSGQNPGQ